MQWEFGTHRDKLILTLLQRSLQLRHLALHPSTCVFSRCARPLTLTQGCAQVLSLCGASWCMETYVSWGSRSGSHGQEAILR